MPKITPRAFDVGALMMLMLKVATNFSNELLLHVAVTLDTRMVYSSLYIRNRISSGLSIGEHAMHTLRATQCSLHVPVMVNMSAYWENVQVRMFFALLSFNSSLQKMSLLALIDAVTQMYKSINSSSK
eukprot:7017229-Ditylum_brightwellii.AAC.1